MSLLTRIKALAHEQGLTLRDIEIQLNLEQDQCKNGILAVLQ